MRRLGLTQRVDVQPQTGERRDALDQNWVPFLAAAGCMGVPLPNRAGDAAALITALNLDGLVLTGGNDIADLAGARNAAPERDALEEGLVGACMAQSLPVLGVCRGAQMLNRLAGGTVTALPGHVVACHRVRPISPSLPVEAFEIASYHDFGIAAGGLAPDLEAVAVADDGSVEAFRAHDGLRAGILWHPERENPFRPLDIRIFTAFFGRQPW